MSEFTLSIKAPFICKACGEEIDAAGPLVGFLEATPGPFKAGDEIARLALYHQDHAPLADNGSVNGSPTGHRGIVSSRPE
jgi:hypothetical protein